MARVEFVDALNGTLTDADALAGAMPANLRAASGLATGALVDMLTAKTTASRAIVSDADGDLAASSVTATELGYLSGVTSAIQTQITAKAPTESPTFTGTPAVPTAAQGTNTTQAASTAFVVAEIAASSTDIAETIHAATEKTTPVDADEFGIVDSAASNVLKRLTWANLKATLLGVFGSNGLQARTSAGVFSARTITGTSNEISVSNGDGISGNPTLSLPTVAKPYGKQSIPIPAGAMKSRTTNGAAAGSAETTTNKNMLVTLDFDTSTQEFAQFTIAMPKSWDEGTVTFVPIWSHASTTTNFGVVWSLAGVALSNDDAGDVAFGTVQTSTDTGGTTDDIYFGPESSAITIAGTPTAEDLVMFQIARVPSDGSDTMAVDARLHGIVLYITTNAGNDA